MTRLAGDSASRRPGGSGTSAAATTTAYVISARSSQRHPYRATSGRIARASAPAVMASAYAIQSYPPANANSVTPRREAIAPEPEELDRGFGVVVLVLVAVV